jgi:hypothetical protein
MSDNLVIFIRHNIDPDYQRDLWDNRRIAIQFEDRKSVEPEDYPNRFAKSAMQLLKDCCDNGAIVAATYKDVSKTEILVGRILKGSTQIELNHRDDYWNKEVQLATTDRCIISYKDYPLLMIQPPMLTLSKWNIGKRTLEAILTNETVEPDVSLLHPSQLEVLCYEYLRATGKLEGLILPIGRSLMNVDIFGLNELGERVIAQVTHQKNQSKIEEKAERLRGYKDASTHLFFFGPRTRLEVQDIEYIAIEDAFDYLYYGSAGEFYVKLVRSMFGRIANN